MSTDTTDADQLDARAVTASADAVARTGARVEHLLDELAAAGADTTERAEELVRSLTSLYGAGLARIMRLLAEQPDPALATRVCDDELVASLLIVHDLHPRSTRQRVGSAIAELRQRFGARVDGLELVEVADGVARLRFPAVVGCPSTHATLAGTIEAAVRAVAPELAEVVFDAVVEAAGDTVAARRTTLIPVESLRRRPSSTPDAPR